MHDRVRIGQFFISSLLKGYTMSNIISFNDFVRLMNNASGTLSAVFTNFSFCFSSDYFTCYSDERSITIINDSFSRFPLPSFSIAIDTIKSIEQMSCTDGSTEFEIVLDTGTITLDVKQEGQTNDVKEKTA